MFIILQLISILLIVPKMIPRTLSHSDRSDSHLKKCDNYMKNKLTILVLGASGDLAKKKTYPSLLDLYINNFLPESVIIIGFARSSSTDEEFRNYIRPFLTKSNTSVSEEVIQRFLSNLYYFRGQYDSPESFTNCSLKMSELEDSISTTGGSSRLFYFAIPPDIFIPAATMIKSSCMSETGWNRLIVEKPFGHDLLSAQVMLNGLGALYREDQIYRIDHYLGKEMVQNLLLFRFGNTIFEPLLNNRYVSNVKITFKEDFGTQGRGGYFDRYGIIRDIMQNHLLQVLSLVAMEAPIQLVGDNSANYIRDAKVNVLRAIKPLHMNDIILGQYVTDAEGKNAGYLDDPTVSPSSNTPTFAQAIIYVNTPRWEGVPFIMKAGKALDNRKAEIRIQYKDAPASGFMFDGQPCARNELVLRLQPTEAVYMKMNVKKPGLDNDPIQSELDLSYVSRFAGAYNPDAYTRLVLDCLKGNQAGFVRSDELEVAWKIFDPLLAEIDKSTTQPLPYVYGSRGPPQADAALSFLGVGRNENYQWTHDKK